MNLPFTLRQVEYVCAVADHRSFRRAAEACRVAQPSLSAQVMEVESALGVRIFERGRGGVLLTAAGELVVTQGRILLRQARDLVDAAAAVRDPLSGSLRVGVIPTVSPYLLGSVAPKLRAAMPRLSVFWHEGKTPDLVGMVAAGELDAALLAEEAELGGLATTPVGVDTFWLAVPRGHALAADCGPVRLEELVDEPVLLLDDGHCFRDQALAVCARKGVREAEFRATSLPTLVQMVAAGLGVTLLPEMAIELEARRANVVVREVEPKTFRTIVLAWRRGSPVGATVRGVAAAMLDASG